MWCGPTAVADLTGWTRDQVWMHVRALREQRGERLTAKPVGGVSYEELRHALDRAGYETELVLSNRRMRYIDFARGIGRTGKWLMIQRRHTFAHTRGAAIHQAFHRCMILGAYRVRRRSTS